MTNRREGTTKHRVTLRRGAVLGVLTLLLAIVGNAQPAQVETPVRSLDELLDSLRSRPMWTKSKKVIEQFAVNCLTSESYRIWKALQRSGKLERNTRLEIVAADRIHADSMFQLDAATISSRYGSDSLLFRVGFETIGNDTLWACCSLEDPNAKLNSWKRSFYFDSPVVRLEKLRPKFGKFAAGVVFGNLEIGMNVEMVEEIYGRPDEVNKTFTAHSQKEQWVYGDGLYVYFDDGQVSAWQLRKK